MLAKIGIFRNIQAAKRHNVDFIGEKHNIDKKYHNGQIRQQNAKQKTYTLHIDPKRKLCLCSQVILAY